MGAAMKYPWMPLYWGDFFAKTLHLSAAELGAYVLLIAHAWQNDAKVPLEHAQRIARIDNRNWKRIKKKVFPFFQCSAPGAVPSELYHERVHTELALAAKLASKRKDAALQMHAHRRANASATAHAKHLPSPSHSPKRSYGRSKQANGTYRPSGMSPDKGDDYRATPSPYKSDNVLAPIPDRPQPKPNPKLETLKKKGREKRKHDEQHSDKEMQQVRS